MDACKLPGGGREQGAEDAEPNFQVPLLVPPTYRVRRRRCGVIALGLTMEDVNLPVQYDAEPHPYLHEPLLYISNIPPYVTDDEIALIFQPCAKFRLKINRDVSQPALSGTIEFQFLDRGVFTPRCSATV